MAIETLLSPPWRRWSVLAGYLVVLAALVTLMQNVRWLDPSGFETRNLGTAMVAAWCAGLGVLLLGVVRRHNSRFTLRTLLILTAVIAVFLGLCQTVHPVIPTMIMAAGLSIAMLYAAQHIGAETQPYRDRLSRLIMAVGGLIFLAHSVRVLGFFMLVRLGLRAHGVSLTSARRVGRLSGRRREMFWAPVNSMIDGLLPRLVNDDFVMSGIIRPEAANRGGRGRLRIVRSG